MVVIVVIRRIDIVSVTKTMDIFFDESTLEFFEEVEKVVVHSYV